MNRGDYMLATFEGDTATPPTTYPAEITFVDIVAETFDCRLIDTGQTFTVKYRTTTSGPWDATDDTGASYGFATHDVYEVEDAGPGSGDVALICFADGGRYLCYVESTDPQTIVQLYHPPYPRITLDIDAVTATEWDRYPIGETIVSLQRCRLNNDLPEPVLLGVFSNGWWSLATRRDAHAGRVGPAIAPYATVIHTTDMTPETWNGLINRWQNQAGQGNGAHFAIGRSANEGVVQLVSINRNANHAGGDGHGSFEHSGQQDHPNSFSVGIEIHCCGEVRQHQGAWRLFSEGVPTGAAIPDSDVIRNPNNANRGWHVVTPYQYEQLAALLDGLEAALEPMPAGCVATALHPVPAYGRFATGRLVGHVSLSPHRRADPWPPTCDWMRTR